MASPSLSSPPVDTPTPHNNDHSTESSSTTTIIPPRPSPLSSMTQPQEHFHHSNHDDTTISTSTIPSGLDAASFIAGERQAYSRAFAAALPSQHALGQLFKAVDTLHARIEQDAALVRSVHTESIRSSSQLSSVSERITHIEHTQLPSLQQRIDAVADRPAISPEVNEALRHLRDVLGSLSQAQQRYLEAASTGYNGSMAAVAGHAIVKHAYALCVAALGFSGSILSKADIAALFLSRKILLAPLILSSYGGSGHRNNNDDDSISINSRNNTTSKTMNTNNISTQHIIQDKVQSIIAASLFVAAVEAAWRLHESARRPLPKTIQRFGSPLRYGLRVARAVVWSSAFVMAVHEVRNVCGGLAHNISKFIIIASSGSSNGMNGNGSNNNNTHNNDTPNGSPLPGDVSLIVENELFDTP